MVRNLLLTAASSIYESQRNESLEKLDFEYKNNEVDFINEVFNLICSQNRTEHILSYSYLKKIIKQGNKQKLPFMNEYMQKSYVFWHSKNINRNTMEQIGVFERQNIIQVMAMYLSMNTSGKYRQQFVDIIPFKICQLYSKGSKQELFLYLTFYAEVLKQLDKYRIGNINSKRAAIGSVMLLKITTRLNPQNSLEASLWLDFSINFSKFNNWTPDKNFYINCLSKYKISKPSLMSLLEHLSSNFKIIWSLEDHCRILQGLNDKMMACQAEISSYSCKQVEIILKCLKNFLHNFFVVDKNIQNSGEALIVEYIYSYEQFQIISKFIINMVDYFSFNNEKQMLGNLSQMIIQYSTQILRLYSNYLKEQEIEGYSRRFLQNLGNQPQYHKIFVFFSTLPKFLLQLFDYEQGVMSILNQTIELSQKHETIYITFLSHYISLNDYVDMIIIEQLARFFQNLIQKRSIQIKNLANSQDQISKNSLDINVQRISLSIFAISKLSKFKQFADSNSQYFRVVKDKIFYYLLNSTNQFSILIQAIGQFISRKNTSWNHKICNDAMMYLSRISQNNLKDQKMLYYQIQIQLYRIIKKTISLNETFSEINNQMMIKNTYFNHSIQLWPELKLIAYVCNLTDKSDAVKQEILYLLQEIFIQINIIKSQNQKSQNQFQNLEKIILNLMNSLTSKSLFLKIQETLTENMIDSSQNIVENNLFQKLQINNQQYALVEHFSKELHLTTIKILLQLCIYEPYLETIIPLLLKSNSKYLYCIWEAIQIIYPDKINIQMFPLAVRNRLEKIRNGNLLDLLQNMDLNQEYKINKKTPKWYELYRNILREDSVLNQIINQILSQ